MMRVDWWCLTGRKIAALRLCFLMLAAFLAHGTIAAPKEDPRKQVVTIPRLEQAATIDGKLDEEVWSRAVVIDNLYQVRPHEFAPASEPTIVRLFYTRDAIYVGAYSYDSQPGNMVDNVLRQGAMLRFEDRFAFILDPFLDRRNGYVFILSSNGVRLDALYNNTTQFASDWDGVWKGESSKVGDGFITEFEIPFNTLNFDANNESWGFNAYRYLGREVEAMAWSSSNRNVNPATGATITGIHDIGYGLGLDIVPSLSSVRQRRYRMRDSEVHMDPSVDVFYKITPSLNASLTVNTDFAATEVDDRQVNLSRFNLFFPEKRSFFLKDSDIFEFGKIGGKNDQSQIRQVDRENARPFFSRRIGLNSNGSPVDIEYGGKLSGRHGEWNVGGLAIRQSEFEGVEASTLVVARIARNVLEESSLGVIATSGDPNSNIDNTLWGMDFRYQNTRLPGGLTLEGEAWYQQSDTDGVDGHDSAFGATVRLPSRNKWLLNAGYKEVQENFNPALGFVNQTGIREYVGEVVYTHRPRNSYFRTILGGVSFRRAQRIDGGLQSQVLGLRFLEVQNQSGDKFKARAFEFKERLIEPFEISPRVVLGPGEYTFQRFGVDVQTGRQRRAWAELHAFYGEFYDGHRLNLRGRGSWAPSKHFRVEASYDYNGVDLPRGDFVTRLVTLQTDVVFSSSWSWVNLLQFDNVSNIIGINSRLHFIPEAGREMFFVIDHSLDRPDGSSFMSKSSDVTLKFNYTLRY